MPKRLVKKLMGKADYEERLRQSLASGSKTNLIDTLLELALNDSHLFHQLGVHFQLEALPEYLVIATYLAIVAATDFEEREANRKFRFRYDSTAYDKVKHHLSRLVELGQLPLAMNVSLELMKRGSCLVALSALSDGQIERLMRASIEDCLAVVVSALDMRDLPPANVISWCGRMLRADRVGIIYREPLRALRSRAKASRP